MNNPPPPLAYTSLVQRLNRFPQGAPPAETLYKILQILFSESEAGLVAQLPIKPFTAAQASRIWKLDITATRNTLDELASRALLLDVQHNGETIYTLPPPMAGFFEFSLMRYRSDIDQKALSELFYQYLTVEEDFMRELVGRGETKVGRVFIQEPLIPTAHVLDYERASAVIQSAAVMAVGTCYCRHKASLVKETCAAPQDDICMTFNGVAESLSKHGYARRVDAVEGLDILQKAYAHNLVQFGENVRQGVSFICNCCGCCCEALIAARRFALSHPIQTSNFIPQVAEENCNGCGKCVNVCPVEAMSLVSANDPRQPKRKKAKVDEDICLGCGVCARVCDHGGVRMTARPSRILTPANAIHRIVLMAIERGGLQDLIFDNRALTSHQVMASILGALLRLPPLKRALASQQVKSRYIEALIARVNL